ncbi:MAG: hypothetical protein Ct9H300mP10_08090 [Methanobacteriota archaeon]|nr:MAG: hypothetical protein Ct9H300mP10_08090 [Euryarchaeota archaeon]
MDPVRTAILLLHPLAALALIWVPSPNQRRWRHQSTLLRGEERKSALADHQASGDKAMAYVVAVKRPCLRSTRCESESRGVESNDLPRPRSLPWLGRPAGPSAHDHSVEDGPQDARPEVRGKTVRPQQGTSRKNQRRDGNAGGGFTPFWASCIFSRCVINALPTSLARPLGSLLCRPLVTTRSTLVPASSA